MAGRASAVSNQAGRVARVVSTGAASVVQRWGWRLALAGLVTLAAYLRLAHLDLAEFKRDEATVALVALEVLAGRVPLAGLGTSVAGLENGPLFVYLLAIPLALARDAAIASGFVGLLNVGAVAVTYRVAERAFGRLPAIAAVGWYTAASWAVLFSRKLWVNEAMPLFSALLALALLDAVVEGRGRGVALAGLWAAALVNLHPSGLALLPVALGALLLRPRLLWSRAALAGAAGGLALSAPLLVHEVTNGFAGLQALASVVGAQTSIDFAPFESALTLVGPEAWAAVAGDLQGDLRAGSLLSDGLGTIAPLLLALGAVAAFVLLGRTFARTRPLEVEDPGASNGRDWRATAVMLLWLLAPLVVSSRRALPFQIHYLIPLIPALAAFIGLGLATPALAIRRLGLPRPAAMAAGLAVGYLAWATAVQVQQFEAFYRLVATAGDRTFYGRPLADHRAMFDRALALASGRRIVVLTGDDETLRRVVGFLAPPSADLRFEDADQFVLAPEPALYVVAPSADRSAEQILAQFGRAVGRADSPPGYAYFLATASGADALSPALARLANGLELAAVAYPERLEPGGPAQIIARWRVTRPPGTADLALFFHLLDDRQEKVTGSDHGGLRGAELAAGKEIVARASLGVPEALPPGRYWIGLGAYTSGDVRRVAVLGDGSAPVGDVVRLGPLKVAAPLAESPVRPPLARFGEAIALDNAMIVERRPPGSASGTMDVQLSWRAAGRPDRAYTVFVHLLDATGRLVGQHDGGPMGGAYPTSLWDAGERIEDVHQIVVPAGSAEPWRLVVGLYDPLASSTRLGRQDSPSDSVEVGGIE